MTMRLGLVLVMATLAVADASAAEDAPVLVHNGFLTGEQFLKLSADARAKYAPGVIDGILLAPLFGAPKAKLGWLEACVGGMTSSQVSAILETFLKENPSRWHEGAHTSMFAALHESCPNRRSDE